MYFVNFHCADDEIEVKELVQGYKSIKLGRQDSNSKLMFVSMCLQCFHVRYFLRTSKNCWSGKDFKERIILSSENSR